MPQVNVPSYLAVRQVVRAHLWGCPVWRQLEEIGQEKAYLSECVGGLGREYQNVLLWNNKVGVCSGADGVPRSQLLPMPS